jgi:hypothetical protein
MVFDISIKRENLSFFKRNCQIKSKLLHHTTMAGKPWTAANVQNVLRRN